jgi:hypothetical protein
MPGTEIGEPFGTGVAPVAVEDHPDVVGKSIIAKLSGKAFLIKPVYGTEQKTPKLHAHHGTDANRCSSELRD